MPTGRVIGWVTLSHTAVPLAAPSRVSGAVASTALVASFTKVTCPSLGSLTGSAIGRKPPPVVSVLRLTRAWALMVGFPMPTRFATLRNHGASVSVAFTSTKPVLQGVPALLSDPPWL